MKKEKITRQALAAAAAAVMAFAAAGCTPEDNDLTSISNSAGQITYAAEADTQLSLTAPGASAVIPAPASSPRLLSTYTTSFKDGAKGRKNNIARAAKSINGVTVEPGQVFSYNETVGPTNKRRGFSLAKIFVNGEEKKGYGGGVCQVSSTLYNAALEAGLEIVERHPHSKKVYYVPENMDAATSYGGIDFKFKNNLSETIQLSSAVTDQDVTINIDVI